MPNNNNNLPNGNTDVTLEPTGAAQGAGEMTPEDTQGSIDYQAVIDAQHETIEKQQALVEQLLGKVDSMNAQIANYVRSVGTPAPEGQTPDIVQEPVNAIPDDYVYLKDLGKEIGKRDR